jgi:hypothetical protein
MLAAMMWSRSERAAAAGPSRFADTSRYVMPGGDVLSVTLP